MGWSPAGLLRPPAARLLRGDQAAETVQLAVHSGPRPVGAVRPVRLPGRLRLRLRRRRQGPRAGWKREEEQPEASRR